MAHKFQLGQLVRVASGRIYRIDALRGPGGKYGDRDNHPKLKSGVGYSAVQVRNGKPYGPSRLMPETSFELIKEEMAHTPRFLTVQKE